MIKTVDPWNVELLDVEIKGSRMIIPGGLGGAILYDISDPQNPVMLGAL